MLRFKVSVNTEAETSVMFYLVYEELLARHSGIYQYTVTIINIITVIIKPWSKSWSKSMSQQIPKLIKVLQKKKIEEFGPRADTKITWATHPPTPPHKPKCLEYTRGVEVKTK